MEKQEKANLLGTLIKIMLVNIIYLVIYINASNSFTLFTCLHYWVSLNFTSSQKKKKKTTTTKKKITHTNKETNEREAKIMIMEVYRVLPL